MTKANVTYEQVAGFCDQQAATGTHPDKISCRDVIRELKCQSSTSTVSDLIKRWREDHAEAVQAGVALTEGDLGAILQAVKFVVASKRGERERELNDRADELNSRLMSTADELAALIEENRFLTEWKDSLEGQLAEAKVTILVLQGSLTSLVALSPSSKDALERHADHDADVRSKEDAAAGSVNEQVDWRPPLSAEAFGSSHQEQALAPGTGKAASLFMATAEISNKGPEEKPHVQG